MNTKDPAEVYCELQSKIDLMKNMIKTCDFISINMKMEGLHLVELFELKTWLESLGLQLKHQTVEMKQEGPRFVIHYRPHPKALLRIYSEFINQN